MPALKISFKTILVIVCSTLVLVSCSRKKDKFISRNFHALTSEFNPLYNGYNALEAGKNSLNDSYFDNYWAVLPIERMQISEEVVLPGQSKNENFNKAEEIVTQNYASQNLSDEALQQHIASYKLEHSFIGITGRAIEPVIRPLGYDWKIGIAIVSSFAAREVFVGTLATIYSVGNDEEETIKIRMAVQVNPILGDSLFNFAS